MYFLPKTFVAIIIVISFCINVQGQTVRLLSLDQLEARLNNGKDTTYVVNFWATWCGPCIKEIPYFERLQSELAGEKVKVLLVSVDYASKLKSAVTPFAKRLKLKNEVFLLNEKNQQVYIDRIDRNWSGALPASIFINKSKGKREFYEKEFTYPELIKAYNSI